MDKSSKLGSYWSGGPGGNIYQLLVIAEDSLRRTIFIVERCSANGEPWSETGLNARVLSEEVASGLRQVQPPPKLRPGLVLAEDENGTTRVFLAEQRDYAEVRLWIVSDESVYGSRWHWEDKGYTDFRMAKTYGGGDFNVTVE